jgi:heat shock protein HslJ
MKKYLITLMLFIGFIFNGCISPEAPKKDFKSGMFKYMADAAVFTDCSTKKSFPVAFEGDYISLEKAYLKTIQEAGKAIKVNVEGEIVLRNGMDGKVDIPTLVVKKFINIIPKEVCQNSKSEANLENTYWKLTLLNNQAIPHTKVNTREAYVILSQGNIKGNSSCNGLGGTYKLDGNKISFSDKGFMTTRMFCKGSVEVEFLKALKQMYKYKLKGEYLEVFDKEDIRLARFESVYLN